MLKRFLGFVVIGAIVIGVGLLFQWNPAVVEFRWTPSKSVSLPLPLLLFGSCFAGAAAIFLLALVRETQWTLAERRRTRREAKRERAKTLVATGRSWLWHGRPDRAKRAIVRAPAGERGVEPPLWLAESALEADRPDEARLLIEDALTVHPEEPRLLALLAEVHAAEQDLPHATALLERAAARAPESPRLAAALRDSYARERRWQEALAAEDRYLALTRSHAEAAREERRQLGFHYELALERATPEESVRDLYPLARPSPVFLPAVISLGDLLRTLGRTSEAARVWIRATATRQEPVLLDRIEKVCRELGRSKRVIALYARLRRRGDSVDLARRLVRFLLVEDDVAGAAATLEACPREFSEDRELLLLRAETERRRGDGARALTALEESFAMCAPDPPYTCAVCEHSVAAWSPRCVACGRWDSLESDGAPRMAATPTRWQELWRRFARA